MCNLLILISTHYFGGLHESFTSKNKVEFTEESKNQQSQKLNE